MYKYFSWYSCVQVSAIFRGVVVAGKKEDTADAEEGGGMISAQMLTLLILGLRGGGEGEGGLYSPLLTLPWITNVGLCSWFCGIAP